MENNFSTKLKNSYCFVAEVNKQAGYSEKVFFERFRQISEIITQVFITSKTAKPQSRKIWQETHWKEP